MKQEVVIAGFGGQGVMLIGQLLAYAGMLENKEVSWLPSYGPEMRGGTANCHVIVADDPIASPFVVQPDVLIAMNLPSLEKFVPQLKEKGILIVNSSLIDSHPNRADIRIIEVPAGEIAADLGNTRVANMVMLGVFLEVTGILNPETIIKALEKTFPPEKQDLIPINREALEKGAALAKNK